MNNNPTGINQYTKLKPGTVKRLKQSKSNKRLGGFDRTLLAHRIKENRRFLRGPGTVTAKVGQGTFGQGSGQRSIMGTSIGATKSLLVRKK